MCQQIVRVCPYCDYHAATSTPSPCDLFWEAHTKALESGDPTDKVRTQDCPKQKNLYLDFGLGCCPELTDCPSAKVVQELHQRKEAHREAQRQAEAWQRQQKDDFIRANCQKRDIPPRNAPESFLVVGARDVRARIHQEELHAASERRKQRQKHQEALQEIMDMWREMDPDDEDSGAIVSYTKTPPGLLEAARRTRQDNRDAGMGRARKFTDSKEPTSDALGSSDNDFDLLLDQPIPAKANTGQGGRRNTAEEDQARRIAHITRLRNRLRDPEQQPVPENICDWFDVAVGHPPRRVYCQDFRPHATEPTASWALDDWLEREIKGKEPAIETSSILPGLSSNREQTATEILGNCPRREDKGKGRAVECSDFLPGPLSSREYIRYYEGAGAQRLPDMPTTENAIHYDGYSREGSLDARSKRSLSESPDNNSPPESLLFEPAECSEESRFKIVMPPPGLGFKDARVITLDAP